MAAIELHCLQTSMHLSATPRAVTSLLLPNLRSHPSKKGWGRPSPALGVPSTSQRPESSALGLPDFDVHQRRDWQTKIKHSAKRTSTFSRGQSPPAAPISCCFRHSSRRQISVETIQFSPFISLVCSILTSKSHDPDGRCRIANVSSCMECSPVKRMRSLTIDAILSWIRKTS